MAKRVGYTVRRVRSGRWQVMVTNAAGVRVGEGTYADLSKAEEEGQAKAVQVRAGLWIDPRAADVAVTRFVGDWLVRRVGTGRHGDRYAEDAARMVRLHVAPTVLGRSLLTDLSPPMVNRWYEELVAKQLEANRGRAAVRLSQGRSVPVRVTAGLVPAKTYRLLHAALQDAVRDRVLPVNPCMVRGAGVERSPERRIIEPGQLLDLAAAVPGRWRAMVLLAGWCGMAFGELAGLRRASGAALPARGTTALCGVD